MNKAEQPPSGQDDENVFDIRQGVCITMLVKTRRPSDTRRVFVCDWWGSKTEKYNRFLSSTASAEDLTAVLPAPPYFYLVAASESVDAEEWKGWQDIPTVFTKRSTGTETGFDPLLVAFSVTELKAKLNEFCDITTSQSTLAEKFDFSKGHAAKLYRRRKELQSFSDSELKLFQIRAYDYRYAFLRKNILKTNSFGVMTNVTADRPGLVTTRQTKESFAAFAIGGFSGHKITSSYDRSYIFPVSSRVAGSLLELEGSFVSKPIAARFADTLKGTPYQHDPSLGVFYYSLAVLSSPLYALRFNSELKRDWPRLPISDDEELVKGLVRLGSELADIQLLKSSKLANSSARFHGTASPLIEGVFYSSEVVWLDRRQRNGFKGIPREVWVFQVGGYQVLEKWLKDRKGRKLSKADIEHYQKVVAAIAETIRIMEEIDEVIEQHGGWPSAFTSSSKTKTAKKTN